VRFLTHFDEIKKILGECSSEIKNFIHWGINYEIFNHFFILIKFLIKFIFSKKNSCFAYYAIHLNHKVKNGNEIAKQYTNIENLFEKKKKQILKTTSNNIIL